MTTFNVTDSAVDAIKAALEKRGTPGAALRVGVRGGGCSGFMYHLEYCDDEPRESDYVFEYDMVKVYLDKKSMAILQGSQLDWEDKILAKGFKFNNPNAANSCGCNLSFDVK
jgi:iron-sulfur cluster assembly protein